MNIIKSLQELKKVANINEPVYAYLKYGSGCLLMEQFLIEVDNERYYLVVVVRGESSVYNATKEEKIKRADEYVRAIKRGDECNYSLESWFSVELEQRTKDGEVIKTQSLRLVFSNINEVMSYLLEKMDFFDILNDLIKGT